MTTMRHWRPTRESRHLGRAALAASALIATVSGLALSTKLRSGARAFVAALAGTVSRPFRKIVRRWSSVDGTMAHDLAGGPPDRLINRTSVGPNERTSAIMYDWETSLRASEYHAARIVPPATLRETGWDILLALHSDRHCGLAVPALSSIVSVPPTVANRWLGALEDCAFITGVRHPSTNELCAILTEKGRELLDRYFSASNDLQVAAHP